MVPASASFGGIRIIDLQLSLDHQSNGRSERLSRGWNRVIGRVTFEKGNLAGYTKLWFRRALTTCMRLMGVRR